MDEPSIRPEQSHEFDSLHLFIQEAFASAPVSNNDEQNFVRRLREGAGYLPELALVAEGMPAGAGELLGHIMLTRVQLTPCDGAPVCVLLLAPLCVKENARRRGIGAALTREALRRAQTAGYTSVFLVGDPAYYTRLGFVPAAEFGIRESSGTVPPQYVLARELAPGALAGKEGVVAIV